MLSRPKLLLITGANKGLGYGIVSSLISNHKRLNYHIILACRDHERGQKAINTLLTSNPNFPPGQINLAQLDISKTSSIENFQNWFHKSYTNQKIDILFNNAGISLEFDPNFPEFNKSYSEQTFQTNFVGTVDFTKTMLPFINNLGKILFMGSSTGIIAQKK